MKNLSICKFIDSGNATELSVGHFVRETDKEIMKKEHRFPHHRAILVTASDAIFTVNAGEQISLSAGDLLFVFAEERLFVTPKEDTEYTYLSFSGGGAGELFARFNINKNNRVFRNNQNMIPFWTDSIVMANQNADLVAQSVLLYTFSRLGAVAVEKDNAVNRAIKVIEERFDDCAFNLCELALELGYTPKYLSQAFKKQTKTNISDYIRNTRIQHATFLFDHGLVSVKNVAYLSGFKDPLHFSCVFKSVVGISPTEYKNKAEKD